MDVSKHGVDWKALVSIVVAEKNATQRSLVLTGTNEHVYGRYQGGPHKSSAYFLFPFTKAYEMEVNVGGVRGKELFGFNEQHIGRKH